MFCIVLYCIVLYCLALFYTVFFARWVQSVQRFAARSLAMCSHSAREQQSAAAAGMKKETPDSHGFTVPDVNWFHHVPSCFRQNPSESLRVVSEC